MQGVLIGLNPAEGPDNVTVYIDDILIFSRTSEDHIQPLHSELKWLSKGGWTQAQASEISVY